MARGKVTAEELLRIKENIEDAQAERNRLEGQLTEIKKRFSEFGCKTLADLKKKGDALAEDLADMEDELDAKFAEFKKKYPGLAA